MTRMHLVRSTCRACDGQALEPVFSFGEVPRAESLLSSAQLLEYEDTYPLDLAFCLNCSLLQTLQTVSPTLLYDETYSYFSSSVAGIREHCGLQVDSLIAARGLNPESLVIELGSNDGCLLGHFLARNIAVLGIEPSTRQANMARRTGVPTLGAFFGRDIANYLRQEGRAADVIIANNVLGKVPDLHGFLAGIRTLLKDDGIVTIESPYVRDVVDECAFDTIHHGQVSYWGASSLDQIARSEGMFLNHVEWSLTHGGTVRYQLGKSDEPSAAVLSYLREEQACGLTEFAYYGAFRRQTERIKESLMALLGELKAGFARITGYGAGAEACTLLNYAGIGTELLDYVVDPSPYKQGHFLPGVHLPVLAPERLIRDKPDYLLLAGSLREEELQLEIYRQRGGRFIVPLPTPTVL